MFEPESGFLLTLGPWTLGAALLAGLLRRLVRFPYDADAREDTSSPRGPDVHELALIAGGRARALRSVVAKLVWQGVIELGPAGHFEAVGKPTRAMPLDEAVHRAACGEDLESGELLRAVRPELDRLERGAVERGYVLPPARRRALVLGMIGLVITPVLVASYRVLTDGSDTADPMRGHLVAAWAASALITLVLCIGAPRRTVRASRILRFQQRARGDLRTTASFHRDQLDGEEAALVLALFGDGALGLQFHSRFERLLNGAPSGPRPVGLGGRRRATSGEGSSDDGTLEVLAAAAFLMDDPDTGD